MLRHRLLVLHQPRIATNADTAAVRTGDLDVVQLNVPMAHYTFEHRAPLSLPRAVTLLNARYPPRRCAGCAAGNVLCVNPATVRLPPLASCPASTPPHWKHRACRRFP